MVNTLDAQTATKKLEEITINSSLRCGMCEATISKSLKSLQGVKAYKINLLKNTIWVKYKSDKTNPDELRNAISKSGYDADNVKADPGAYMKLPSCCKKPS